MYSDIDTIERIEILRDPLGAFDVLVGINLLREGLDIPECGLVAIWMPTKKDLRSETSLVQTIGCAARNAEGRVIMYADKITGSMGAPWRKRPSARQTDGLQRRTRHHTRDCKERRRCSSRLHQGDTDQARVTAKIEPQLHGNLQAVLDGLRDDMRKAAENLEFEEAARLRDEVKRLETVDLTIADDPLARQYAVEKAVDDAQKASGRSTAGRAGQRGGNKRRKR